MGIKGSIGISRDICMELNSGSICRLWSRSDTLWVQAEGAGFGLGFQLSSEQIFDAFKRFYVSFN